jgi:hypothetical protein
VVVSYRLHRDGLSRCLWYGLSKGGNSVVEINGVLDGRMWV